jgi:2-haloacid dehalogenase
VARACVFDAMGTLFDRAPLARRLAGLGAPAPALEAWFERTLHGAATLALTGAHRPFPELAEASLRSTLAQLGLDPDAAGGVMEGFAELPLFPDAERALERLEAEAIAAAVLTNGTREATLDLLERAGVRGRFAQVVSVDDAGAYKPHPAPYRTALERLGAEPGAAVLVAAHGWDVLGALAAGMQAVWVDRSEREWPFPLPEPPRAGGLAEAAAVASALLR